MALTLKARGHDGSAMIEQPKYTVDLSLRGFTSRWNARAEDGQARTKAKLDADINVTLPCQWALLQPAARIDEQGCICIEADASMDWRGLLAPGLEGVRLLIVTTLVWGWNIRGDQERTDWSYLATDMLHVLRILVQQARLRDARELSMAQDHVEGRKKSTRKRCVALYCTADRSHHRTTARRVLDCVIRGSMGD